MVTIFVLGASVFSANAQFLRTSYFMEGTHYRQQLNPALAPTKGYVNIPVLGAFNMSVGSTSIGYQDILDIVDNSSDGDYFTSNDFMKRLKSTNSLNLNLSTDILSAGWYRGQNFWSFNVGLRVDMGASIPKSMFSFMREMDGMDFESLNWSNYSSRVDEEKLNINAYTELGVGYSRAINERLTVGGRVKVLLGIGNLNLQIKNMSINANLSGIPTNESGTPDIGAIVDNPELAAMVRGTADINVDAKLESSFKGLELVENEEGYIDDFDFDAGNMGIAGYGGAIDLGATYNVWDNLTVSAAILDLGFISWSKGSTNIATANTDNLSFDSNTPGDIERFADIVSNGEVLNFDMLNMENSNGSESRKTWLHSTLVLGAEYGLLNNKLGVGVLSTTRFTQPKAMTELTFSANYRPRSWFNVALSYSAIQSAGRSFGLGLKLGSFFLGTDYMFLGKNSRSVNGFLGISVPLGGRKTDI